MFSWASLLAGIVNFGTAAVNYLREGKLIQAGEDKANVKAMAENEKTRQKADEGSDSVKSDADVERVLDDEGYRD
mgnify:CR=1 FL=1|tara:strand:+ start:3031 stop:3255 length:225 start_codon:yes stop_codon:yes gene_type:complete